VAKAKKKPTPPKYTPEAIRSIVKLSEHFSMTHQLLKGLSEPSRPMPARVGDVSTWRAPVGNARDWIVAEAKHMKYCDEIREGMIKTNFAKELARRMDAAFASGRAPRPVGYPYIKNKLFTWGLWPISSIE
jgi:hypothetical protein